MIVHTVLFWLRPDLPITDHDRFVRGLRSLAVIRSVRRLLVGPPAATPPRAPVDATFTYALTVLFDDLAGHDAYQADPVHDRFLAECSSLWRQVRVYDALVDATNERLGE